MFLFFFFTATSLLLFDFRRVNLSLQPRWMATHRQQTPWANSLHLQALGWVSLSFPWILSFLQGNNILESPPFACFSSPICHVTQGGKRLFVSSLINNKTFPGGSDSKESACSAGDPVWSLGQEDPLEEETETHSSILTWRIPWTEEPARLKPMGSQSRAQFSSVQPLSRVWLLRPHGLQHARPPCPSPTSRVYSNLCPLSQWCHPTISSSVVPFSSCLQSFPASRVGHNWATNTFRSFSAHSFHPSIHRHIYTSIHPSTHPSSQQIFIEHFLSIPPGVFLGAEDTVVNKPRVSLVSQRLQQ